jgi:hypothetical protein
VRGWMVRSGILLSGKFIVENYEYGRKGKMNRAKQYKSYPCVIFADISAL